MKKKHWNVPFEPFYFHAPSKFLVHSILLRVNNLFLRNCSLLIKKLRRKKYFSCLEYIFHYFFLKLDGSFQTGSVGFMRPPESEL